MRLIISDMQINVPRGDILILNNGKIKPCRGCFCCWLKTPGRCALKDGYQNMGLLMGLSCEVVIISECHFGGYSSFVKNVLDRSVSYVSALFEIRKGIMRHKPRYAGNLNMRVLFYGAGGQEEKDAARELARANAENLGAVLKEVSFYKNERSVSEAPV